MFVRKQKICWSLWKLLYWSSTISKESYRNKSKIVTLNCQLLLLRERYTEIKAWHLKFPYKTSSEMFWKKTSFERKDLSQPFDNKSWYQKKNKLNLILTNPELFIIYWTCHHLFWFRFLKLLLIFYCQSSWREISILKKQFLIMPWVS